MGMYDWAIIWGRRMGLSILGMGCMVTIPKSSVLGDLIQIKNYSRFFVGAHNILNHFEITGMATPHDQKMG